MVKEDSNNQILVEKVALFGVGSSSWQGGIQYVINFIAGLNFIAQKQDSNIHVLIVKSCEQNFDGLDEFSFLDIEFVDIENGIPKARLIKKIYNFVKFKLLNLNYSPRLIEFLKSQKVDFVFPASLPISTGLNSAGWVADFQHRNFPNVIDEGFTKKAEKWIFDELKYSSKVVLSSKYCQNDCERFFPQYLHKTVVMPFAVYLKKSLFNVDSLKRTIDKYKINQPFFIISNLFAVTKNHKIVFDALGILKKAGLVFDLYCTGNIVDERDIGFANEILKYISLNDINGEVHLLGLIPREDQISLYRLSLAMIQPSMSEGWSTCVEEAKHLGKDMLLSNIDVHREQWPTNPWFFNPNDSLELSIKMEQLFYLNHKKEFPDLERENSAINNYNDNFIAFSNAIQKVISF